MKKLIPFAMLCLTLQGCVGLVVSKTQTKLINDPVVSLIPDYPSDSVRKPDASKPVNDRGEKSDPTSEWLQRYWGAPARINHVRASSDEVWTYNSDLIWEGVVPFVVIPVPLLVPATREKVCFSIHDGRVVGARLIESCTVGGTYGFIPNPEGGGSFGAWNWADENSSN